MDTAVRQSLKAHSPNRRLNLQRQNCYNFHVLERRLHNLHLTRREDPLREHSQRVQCHWILFWGNYGAACLIMLRPALQGVKEEVKTWLNQDSPAWQNDLVSGEQRVELRAEVQAACQGSVADFHERSLSRLGSASMALRSPRGPHSEEGSQRSRFAGSVRDSSMSGATFGTGTVRDSTVYAAAAALFGTGGGSARGQPAAAAAGGTMCSASAFASAV